MKIEDRASRASKVNELIRAIGDNGRRFFYNKNADRYAEFEVDGRGRCWIIDEFQGCRIYTHQKGSWNGFSNGGTLLDLAKAFRNFIVEGRQIRNSLGPWPDWYCDGDLWGYGGSMELVRAKATELGVMAAPCTE